MSRRQKEESRYHLSLWVICVLCMGAGVCTEERQKCIWGANRTSQVDISCPRDSDMIEVLYLYYATISLSAQAAQCQKPNKQLVTCRCTLTHGTKLIDLSPFSICSGARQGCTPTIGNPPAMCTASGLATCTSFNFFYMEYSCIPEEEIVDLCGDGATVNLTSPTHLAYFPSGDDNPYQNCTCVIKGGHHKLTAVHAGIPQRESTCVSVSLRIDWNETSPAEFKSRSVKEYTPPLINEDVTNNSSVITQIYYTRDCSTLTPPAWFKLEFESPASQPTIYCGSSVADDNLTTISSDITLNNTTGNYTCEPDCSPTSTTVTLPSSTPATDLIPPKTTTTVVMMNANMTSMQVTVITVSVIGGLLMVAMVIVLACVICRTSSNRKHPVPSSGIVTSDSETGRYEEVHMYHNDVFAADCTGEAQRHCITGNVITHLEKSNPNCSLSSQTTTNHCSRAASYDQDYDHIQSVPSTEPSRARNKQIGDDTYHKLYEGRECFKPQILYLGTDQDLYESSTDIAVNSPGARREGVYSEMGDPEIIHDAKRGKVLVAEDPTGNKLRAADDRTGGKLQIVDDLPRRRSPNPRTKVPDSYMYSTVNKPKNPLIFYHVLEKEDFRTSSEHDTQRSLTEKLVDGKGDQATTSQRSHGEDVESFRRDPTDEVQFVENDLYQSAKFVDNDLHHGAEFVENDLYQSAEFVDNDLHHGAEFVENDLYQSAEFVDNDLHHGAEFVENDLYQSAEFVDNDLHHGAEFVENDLYQSAEFVDNDMAIVDKPKQSLPFHHALENEDFPTSPEYDDERRITENLVDENGEQETASQISHGEDLEYPRRDPSEEVQFVDNDLYQSAEFVDNDLYQSAEFVDNDLYQSAEFVDNDMAIVDKPKQSLSFHHVLENDDFPTSPEHDDQRGITENLIEENGDQEPKSKISHCEDLESPRRDPSEEVQFVDNDLYQSAEFVDNDLHQGVESVDNDLYQGVDNDVHQSNQFMENDLYQTAEFVDLHQGSVFVDNDLYQGVENVDNNLHQNHHNDLHQGAETVDNGSHQTAKFGDNDLYEGSVFVENDLYQSADSL